MRRSIRRRCRETKRPFTILDFPPTLHFFVSRVCHTLCVYDEIREIQPPRFIKHYMFLFMRLLYNNTDVCIVNAHNRNAYMLLSISERGQPQEVGAEHLHSRCSARVAAVYKRR